MYKLKSPPGRVLRLPPLSPLWPRPLLPRTASIGAAAAAGERDYGLPGAGVSRLLPELRRTPRPRLRDAQLRSQRDGRVSPREADDANRAFLRIADGRRDRFDWESRDIGRPVAQPRDWDRRGMRGYRMRQTQHGATFDLQDVLFETGSARLRPAPPSACARSLLSRRQSRGPGPDRRPYRFGGQRRLQPASFGTPRRCGPSGPGRDGRRRGRVHRRRPWRGDAGRQQRRRDRAPAEPPRRGHPCRPAGAQLRGMKKGQGLARRLTPARRGRPPLACWGGVAATRVSALGASPQPRRRASRTSRRCPRNYSHETDPIRSRSS